MCGHMSSMAWNCPPWLKTATIRPLTVYDSPVPSGIDPTFATVINSSSGMIDRGGNRRSIPGVFDWGVRNERLYAWTASFPRRGPSADNNLHCKSGGNLAILKTKGERARELIRGVVS